MTKNKPIYVDGVDVSACERHCTDNYNTPNRCYSDMTENYRDCRPKENQCNFYITSIEKQLARKTQECEELKTKNEKLKEELLDLQLQIEEEQLRYEI